MEIFGWIGTVLFTTCYIPQLYHTYLTKQVHDVSLVMWLIQWAAYTSCLVYAVSIKATPMIIGYCLGWLMTAWWLELYRQYRNIPQKPKDVPQTCDERMKTGESHSPQNLDARLYRLEQVMAALLHVLGYRAE